MLVVLLLLPLASAHAGSGEGVLVRVDGDVTIGPNETIDTLVVVGDRSHARIEGGVHTLVIVGGSLDLVGTVHRDVVLLNAHARLHNGSVIEGDVAKMGSVLIEEDGNRIDGVVDETMPTHIAPVLAFVFGVIFLVGVPLALIIAGMAAGGLFPRQVRTVGRTLTRDFGSTVLTALVVWIALPFVAFLTLFTIIGIPTGLGILLVLLPFLWIAGFIAAGVRLGDVVLGGRRRNVPHDRPIAAAAVGLLILMLAGILPIVGGVIIAFAGILGGAALVLAAWRAARGTRPEGENPPPGASATPASAGQPWDPGAGGS